MRGSVVWKEIGSVWKGQGGHQTVGKESEERPWSGSNLDSPAVSARWGKKPGHFLRGKSADREVQCHSRNPHTPEALWPRRSSPSLLWCGREAHIALDFKAQHLGSLVNHLTLNKKLPGTFSRVPIVPNLWLNKVICVALFQYQSVHPECFIIVKGVCQRCILSFLI